jgi:aminoglycoside/choline kinase family phosphotransferase
MGRMKPRNEMIDFARESLGIQQDVAVEFYPFVGRGSNRTYFRFRWNRKDSVILVRYQPGRIENTYFAEIATFLLENDIPAPQIIRHDADRCLIIMKDLGDTDLWSLRNLSWETRRSLYQKTLTIAYKLHSCSEQHFPFGRVKLMEAFGPDLYRWERNYFLDNFVAGLCRIELDPTFMQQLEMELEGLAQRLSSCGRNLIHRDLQAQNVMIYREEPFLIDFQGMRFGTKYYDLGSLLCDPYVAFSENERRELLSFYYELSESDRDWGRYQNRFWDGSAQRLMQALGAYSFLGLQRGLKDYLMHVPAGLLNLRAAAENAISLPRLLELCAKCDEALATEPFEIRD